MADGRWQEAVATLAQRIGEAFGFRICLCGEIECVVRGLEGLPEPDIFWQQVMQQAQALDIPIDSIAQEEHPDHYEFRLSPTEPLRAALVIEQLRALVIALSAEYGLECLFEAGQQPPYSGLHWHIHLTNADGVNVFLKQDEQMSEPLRHVLGGLLATMRELMPCFAPREASYARLRAGADHIPQVVSWGGNNRSVALRMPESVVPVRHIEHRVCGADADALIAVWALLVGVHVGLKHKPDPGAQIYGRAHDAVYDLPRLPLSLSEAEGAWQESRYVKDYIESARLDA